MLRSPNDSLNALKRLYPSIDPFALLFDNEILKLRFIPSENKIFVQYKDVRLNGWFNVLDFWFITVDSIEFVTLGLVVGFFSTAGTVTTTEIRFDKMRMELL
jgi:hypothetical protein